MLYEVITSASEENEALFDSLERIFHQVNSSVPYEERSIEHAWNKVKPQFKEQQKVIPLWKRREVYIGAAALAVITFLIGSLWQSGRQNPPVVADKGTNDTIVEQTHLIATKDIAEFKLKDKSRILLEPGSAMDIEADFNSKQRVLSLTGSGTFDVTHDESMPFTIRVGKLKVVDVGTVFDIRSSGDTVKVVVSEVV